MPITRINTPLRNEADAAQDLGKFGMKVGADAFQAAQDRKLRELLQVQSQEHDMAKLSEQDRLSQEAEARGMTRLKDLQDANPGMSVSAAGVGSVGGSQNVALEKLGLSLERMKNLESERDRKSVQDVADRSTRAGTAQVAHGLKRAQEAVPGLYQEGGNPQLKSVGGWKNMVPTFAAPLAEKVGLFDPGASKERAALQELQNIKIYDSSGKQINEEEMKRIAAGMGLRGVFEPSIILDALNQMGYTTLQKQKQVSAGADPEALETFRKSGGLAGYETLEDLLGAAAGKSPAAPPAPPKMSFEEFKKAKAEGRL